MSDTAMERAPVMPVERPLDTVAASRYLAEHGFPHAPATLAKLRCVGGGPLFLKHGSRVRYRPSALNAWLQSRTRELAHTSQAA